MYFSIDFLAGCDTDGWKQLISVVEAVACVPADIWALVPDFDLDQDDQLCADEVGPIVTMVLGSL